MACIVVALAVDGVKGDGGGPVDGADVLDGSGGGN